MDGIPGITDSTGVNEGFYRIYTVSAGNEGWLRGDWPGTSSTLPTPAQVLNCGDWHRIDGTPTLHFFPAAAHPLAWFATVMVAGGMTAAAAANESNATVTTIMQNPNARCYLGGDPHLASITRTIGAGYTAAQIQGGGDETTFTPTDARGSWSQYTATPNGTIAARRPQDARYLYPLYRGFNTNTKGVMYVNGTVGISGVLRGDITLYSPNTVVILDDLRYANDPARGVCVDILGIISGANTIIADNSLNSPEYIKVSGGSIVRSLDDTPDMYLHAVVMALGNSFGVQNYSTGSNNAIPCGTTTWGRGCLYLTGGLIQNTRGAVGTGGGTGYVKRYSYDRCAVVNPPPYFPTTGRFQDNRYYELDPVRFNVRNLFQSLVPH
jgi:hypothetical protein